MIKNVILFTSCFFSLSLMGRELQVKDRFFTYNLTVEESLINFKTVNSDISIEKKKCNAHIVERFGKLFDRQMKKPLGKVQRLDSIDVKLDSEAGYAHKKDERGKFLISMPNQIKQLKIEEGLNCNKKN